MPTRAVDPQGISTLLQSILFSWYHWKYVLAHTHWHWNTHVHLACNDDADTMGTRLNSQKMICLSGAVLSCRIIKEMNGNLNCWLHTIKELGGTTSAGALLLLPRSHATEVTPGLFA